MKPFCKSGSLYDVAGLNAPAGRANRVIHLVGFFCCQMSIDFVLLILATALLIWIISTQGVILATEQELSDKLDQISATVTNVAADVTELKALLEAAEGIPQEIMDKANSIADALAAVDAQHPA